MAAGLAAAAGAALYALSPAPLANRENSMASPATSAVGPVATMAPAPGAARSSAAAAPNAPPLAAAGPNTPAQPAPDASAAAQPAPIPLGRETRDPLGRARVAAQQVLDNERQMADSAAPRPGQEFQHARVAAADIGVAFLPNAMQQAALSTRTAEPGYGSTVSTQLRSSTGLASALDFYRKELAQRLPRATLDVQHPGPSFATLTATDPQAGTRVSVFLNASSPRDLAVTLSRWDGRDDASASASASAPAPGNPAHGSAPR